MRIPATAARGFVVGRCRSRRGPNNSYWLFSAVCESRPRRGSRQQDASPRTRNGERHVRYYGVAAELHTHRDVAVCSITHAQLTAALLLDHGRGHVVAPRGDCGQGRHAATPRRHAVHNFCVRTDRACNDIDGGDESFCIVADGGVSTRLLLEALASGKRKRAAAADFRDETP